MKFRNTTFSDIKWGKPQKKNTKKPPTKKCSICKEVEITAYNGNNADPINNGECCSVCNDVYVIPARIKQLRQKK